MKIRAFLAGVAIALLAACHTVPAFAATCDNETLTEARDGYLGAKEPFIALTADQTTAFVKAIMEIDPSAFQGEVKAADVGVVAFAVPARYDGQVIVVGWFDTNECLIVAEKAEPALVRALMIKSLGGPAKIHDQPGKAGETLRRV